ncbi:2Fe-2S iron-sulfur cluster binding domain-containing protein [Marinobacterium sp. D7]|uniref:2Fe-2S iron-sulfur cluster-binding protein n=1 Tax=Marinobacterium ramblicola TaxID=2849041 RepID=UPI001C2CECA0|nr:2Fe-2S iron-sulfur cluster-binding protein [Marinobacterium ramblicola]MBV1787127.1 2Fe-2S iron-sulfur cluster binding domain-containing protein [Marinobacterium ramblicola]
MSSQIGNPAVHADMHQVHVQDEEVRFKASSAVNLLVAMEQARESVIGIGCRGGGCGKCRIRVLDGDYETKRMSRAWVTEEDEAQGIVLACRIFARSDLTIIAEPLPMAYGYQPGRPSSLKQAELK